MFLKFQNQGFTLKVLHRSTSSGQPIHAFCGENTVEGAVCPNCAKKLMMLLNINLNDNRIEIEDADIKELPLLFCWPCSLAQSLFTYRVSAPNNIQILQYKKGNREKDFPYENYPETFPAAMVDLVRLSDIEQAEISKYNAAHPAYSLYEFPPKNQIGGEPILVQPIGEPIICPDCGKQMPLLATIGDECTDERGFTGNSYVQTLFFYCSKCRVISTYQQCD